MKSLFKKLGAEPLVIELDELGMVSARCLDISNPLCFQFFNAFFGGVGGFSQIFYAHLNEKFNLFFLL